MDFVGLCKRWKISPNSSRNSIYDLFRGVGIIETPMESRSSWIVNTTELHKYERLIGFKAGMLTIEEYSKKYNINRYQISKLLIENKVPYCNLFYKYGGERYRLLDVAPTKKVEKVENGKNK